jgi:hypothetical protein
MEASYRLQTKVSEAKKCVAVLEFLQTTPERMLGEV